MSAGTAKPTTCPRCRFPAAYGQAGATRIFLGLFCFANELLRLGEGHDTSRPLRSLSAEFQHEPRHEGECGERERRTETAPNAGGVVRRCRLPGTPVRLPRRRGRLRPPSTLRPRPPPHP